MKYCSNCGNKLNEDSIYCAKCGINLFNKESLPEKNKSSQGINILCGIIGFFFPIIGSIIYIALKNTNYEAAKVANRCSWLGFLIHLLVIINYGFIFFPFIF